MFNIARFRIPLKGPILAYGGIALSLAATAHFAQRNVQQLSPDVEGELAPLMSMAGLDETELLRLLDPVAGTPAPDIDAEAEVPDVSYLMSRDQLRERRSGGWTYPPFDTDGRHGAPLVPTPRNVIVRLVDAHDEPIVATRLQVRQSGRDGAFSPSAYRSRDDSTVWTIGSPLLSPGGAADFELLARTETGVYMIVARLRRIAASGDIDLGSVRMGRR